MTFTQSMNRRNLLVTLCTVGALCGASQTLAWELPGRPTHPDQCQPNQWSNTPDWRQWMNQRQQITIELSRRPSCDKMHNAPSTAWTNCMNQGMRNADELYRRHDAIRDQATREYASAQRQCEAVARQNLALIKQQEDNHQRAQQQAALERQRAQLAERENALAAARSEALRAQQQADLERANRQQAQQARNDPRVVQTPQMQAQARAEAEQRARAERAQEQQALRDVAGALLSGSRSHVRREWYDQTLNPAGTHDAAIDNAEEQARRQNANINRARQINPIATRTADNAYAATGAIANNAVGQLAALDTLNTPAPPRLGSGTFSPGGQSSAAQAGDEVTFWNSIKGSTNPRDFQTYLSHFPRGRFQSLAESRIYDLTGVPVTQAQPQSPAPTTDAQRRWYRD